MTLARVNSNLLETLPNNYGTFFDKFFNEAVAPKRNLSKFNPQVDAIETEKHYQLQIALPGFLKENILLDFEENKLTISGERKFDTENKENKYHFIETNYGSFKRSFYLPENIQENGIEASFENGILNVVVLKDEKKVLKRQIEVK